MCSQVQRLQEDVRHLDGEKHEHESTIIEQQDHIEKLQDSCRELQEAGQAVQQDSELKYAASVAQMKAERKQQVTSAALLVALFVCIRVPLSVLAEHVNSVCVRSKSQVRCQHCSNEG